ncbi:MAG: hypothetical protein OEW90_10795 [Betaproteobacteria bacterium]|nr:hypothetical protein [Betaproteobacteria bacterium]MDH4324614.1 hypothetical protein [Betaproteobacteria bacterium]
MSRRRTATRACRNGTHLRHCGGRRAEISARERIREHLALGRGRAALECEVALLRAASKVEILMPQ